ncbi:MAG: hypothetical protein P1Q69_16900 [Candidatus Thorarchaeota archaeon]|nr:hypothetical protein [Candidatus Thorarchaeota archaeon]
MASEYVEIVILAMRIIAIVANVILFYGIYILNTGNTEAIRKRGRNWIQWLAENPIMSMATFILWFPSPLIAVVLSSDTYRMELMTEIFPILPLISIPLAPFALVLESARLYRARKENQQLS